MDKKEMRKKDFITSLNLIAFGIFMILYTIFYIPMKDSWGGVMNVWYVSPGLFPVCIGILIILLGLVLLRRAILDGGARKYVEDLSRGRQSPEKTLRLLGILTVISAYVYLHIPRVDYFLSTVFCLLVFISFFYLEAPGALKKLFSFYLSGCLFLFVLSLAGIDRVLNEIFPYAMDLLVLVLLLAYALFCWKLVRHEAVMRRRFRLTVIMAIVPSLVLIPSFKYFLLVPLPVEGAFIEVMNIVRYSLR
jgi:uncharacterized membrane protein YidH (DUF202 family)